MQRSAYVAMGTALILLGAGYWLYSAMQIHLDPPTPPLLKGARASSGWFSEGCPPQSRWDDPAHEAIDTDVETRLEKQFPAGTPAILLQQSLLAQGFAMIKPCPNDSSIKRARFMQRGTGFLPYTAFSIVAWQADPQDRIIWTKPELRYDGL